MVPFDVVVDSDNVIMVNESQTNIGRLAGEYLLQHIPAKTGKIIEVRGIAGTSVDQDRHDGFRAALPNAEVHAFEDANHYVLEDKAEVLVPAIRRFLASNPI